MLRVGMSVECGKVYSRLVSKVCCMPQLCRLLDEVVRKLAEFIICKHLQRSPLLGRSSDINVCCRWDQVSVHCCSFSVSLFFSYK